MRDLSGSISTADDVHPYGIIPKIAIFVDRAHRSIHLPGAPVTTFSDMTTAEQIKYLRQRVDSLKECLDIDEKRRQVEALSRKTEAPDFWSDPKSAESFLKNLNSIKSWVTGFDAALRAVDDLDVLYEFAKDSLGTGVDEAIETEETRELDSSFKEAVQQVESLELKNMLGGEGDNLGAVLTINSGAGGTEANDWSAMLMRMYTRWGERSGMKMTVSEILDGDEAGIKSATIQFEGDYAYGYLKAENGVHRLVRISPFNAQGKRQTSFVSLEVMPELNSDIDVEIRPEDIRHYVDLFDTIKLATRESAEPEYVLLAYTMEKWPANLLDILEPGHANVEGMPFIANARFPEDWFEHTTHCGHHCDTCGYCKTVFEKVARTQQGFSMLS
mgnify:CR=1 FL=1